MIPKIEYYALSLVYLLHPRVFNDDDHNNDG